MRTKAFIAGCTGMELSEAEADFFRKEQPWGFIIFAHNIEDREQVSALTSQMRACVGRDDAPILIDEEGGRVQRLRPPHWLSNPPGQILGKIYQRDASEGKRAAWLLSRLIAHDLLEIGVNVDCLPILDVPVVGVSDAIGDRAYSRDVDVISEIGQSVVDGLMAGGVLPIVKHMPGHGRAICDSHFELPLVTETLEELIVSDFKPFKALNKVAMAMTAHIVFEAIDANNPATTSTKMIDEIIRGTIGFDGLLMSDDISMEALSGDYVERTKSSFAAGCDIVLHCNGKMDEMLQVASATPELKGQALKRAQFALSQLKPADNQDIAALRTEFDNLVSQCG